ncbi:MAG: dynamin family protein [Pseudomonadota bacterium]
MQRLHAFAHWKAAVIDHLKAYEALLKDMELDSPEQDLRIDDVINKLKQDRIVIAFVAEFSRGKTELINSIFFANYKRRLLPSEAGRTTMCPTELFYDSKSKEAYIRLLPIETRLEDISLAEHKKNLDYWTTLPIDTSSAEKMAATFKEVVKVKRVSIQDAKNLGLFDETMVKKEELESGQIEIPMWRHALISFPHPLLEEGLVIMDTPGLNALGNEPELTVDMLPNAHAVMFVLAADTGVTKSDMEMWKQHVHSFTQGGQEKGLMVVLNKIDTLWDELLDADAVEANIRSQCNSTAKVLNVGHDRVFPVSAHKALLAKVKQDDALLKKSGIQRLEQTLSNDILPDKQNIIRDNAVNEVGAMVTSTKDVLTKRYKSARDQRDELTGMDAKNEAMITHLIKTTREETIAYKLWVDNFQTSRNLINGKIKEILDVINIKMIDTMIEDSRKQMQGSWTTGGMKESMKIFFDQVAYIMNQINDLGDQANEVLLTVYKRFHEEFGLPPMKPLLFSNHAYQGRMEKLLNRANEYRDSSTMAMTEQSFVIKRFFISVVSHARDVLFKAHEEAEKWSKNALAPLAMEIKERKRALDKRIDNLNRVRGSKETLEARLAELQDECVKLEKHLKTLAAIEQVLHAPVVEESEQKKAAVG